MRIDITQRSQRKCSYCCKNILIQNTMWRKLLDAGTEGSMEIGEEKVHRTIIKL